VSVDAATSHWVHDLNPVIYQFTDTLAIRWYGLAYVAGFLVAFGLLNLYWKRGRSPVEPRVQESLAMAMILGVVLGGRLGYFLLYDLADFLRNPLIFFQVWKGGMASHGGFAGVAVAAIWVARKHRLHPLILGDLIASVAAPGLFFGRLANFINGELWGRITEVPWAVIFPQSAPAGMPVHLIPPRHPSQLYEAILEGLIPFVYIQWRFWTVRGRDLGTRADKPAARPGHLTGEFLVIYSIGRWIAELFREPDAALIVGMSRGSFYSVFLLACGLGLIAWSRGWLLTNRQSR
jgi:phosphatidylglycerol:prolipoprotein diacylglycerol transferase